MLVYPAVACVISGNETHFYVILPVRLMGYSGEILSSGGRWACKQITRSENTFLVELKDEVMDP